MVVVMVVVVVVLLVTTILVLLVMHKCIYARFQGKFKGISITRACVYICEVWGYLLPVCLHRVRTTVMCCSLIPLGLA